MRLSLIIPLFNEVDSLIELNKAIIKVVSSMKIKYEIIYVDDGSTDNSWNIITQLCKSSTNLKGIKFLRNFGKSQALSAGFDLAKGKKLEKNYIRAENFNLIHQLCSKTII